MSEQIVLQQIQNIVRGLANNLKSSIGFNNKSEQKSTIMFKPYYPYNNILCTVANIT